MANDLDVDDQWLYGSSEALSSPVKSKGEPGRIIKENGNGTAIERPQTPTLDDMEVALDAPSLPAVSKIVSTAPDLQPKQPSIDDSSLLLDEGEEELTQEEDGEREGGKEGVVGESAEYEGESESEDEDDVQITIGEITTAPGGYNRTPGYPRPGGVSGAVPGTGKKVDVDAVPQIAGQSLLELDLEANAEKPWRLPGADVSDYFNYGFTEETWKLYCDKQRRARGEVSQLNKIAQVHTVRPPILDNKSIPPIGIPPHHPVLPGFPPPPFIPLPPVMGHPDSNFTKLEPSEKEGGGNPDESNEGIGTSAAGDNTSDGRATPGIDAPISSSNKPPLLPPPIPPVPPRPPFGMPPPGFPGVPPVQDNIAAAMAAMFGGGIRPPDPMSHPPHMLPNMPPFPPPGFHGPDHGIMPPPFPGMPPPFPMPGADHGPMLDERGLPINPDMSRLLSQGFPWDPSMGPPPPELLEAFRHVDERRGSRSRSHSSSYSRSRSRSRSSSYEDRGRSSGKRRDRRHRRSRSRSHDRERDRDRDRHRSSRHHRNGDHHHRSDRYDRDRDRDRERDRDKGRDRESRKRREHREEKSSRHERSSRRHRSSSRGRDEERSSHKEKMKEQEQSRESRSRSRTPT